VCGNVWLALFQHYCVLVETFSTVYKLFRQFPLSVFRLYLIFIHLRSNVLLLQLTMEVSTVSTTSAHQPSDQPSCERKHTKPSVIVPPARSPTLEVDATGSRRLPETSGQKRDLGAELGLEELGLTLSDEDEELEMFIDHPSPAERKTIVISPSHHPSRSHCKYLFVKGPKKGSLCGKRTAIGRIYCGTHVVKTDSTGRPVKTNKPTPVVASVSAPASTPVTVPVPTPVAATVSAPDQSVRELKSKIESLEKVVLNLMKDRKLKTESRRCNINKDQTNKSSPTAIQTVKSKFKRKHRAIQRIRLWKMNTTKNYLLVGFEEEMPLVKSNGQLYQVKMPNSMKNEPIPKPNGKWSLVCDHSESKNKMVWKEI